MTIVAAVLAVALVAVVILFLRHVSKREDASAKVLASVLVQHSDAAEKWAEERRELLNRIQRPEHVPHIPVEGYEIPEREPDGWNKVGTVEITREWLEGDD